MPLLVSVVPVIELRGAIPIGVALGLHPFWAMLASIVGNMLPVPFIILFVLLLLAHNRIYAIQCVQIIHNATGKNQTLFQRSRIANRWSEH